MLLVRILEAKVYMLDISGAEAVLGKIQDVNDEIAKHKRTWMEHFDDMREAANFPASELRKLKSDIMERLPVFKASM
jgi:DNA transposition AAA+ family ATPase